MLKYKQATGYIGKCDNCKQINTKLWHDNNERLVCKRCDPESCLSIDYVIMTHMNDVCKCVGDLIKSGYDGPFSGDNVVQLFKAYSALEVAKLSKTKVSK